KPKNIFIAPNDQLVLGDFGIIFPNDGEERITKQGTLEFSRDWIPDWVRFAEIDKYGPKIDVFMVARVLYYMLSGGQKVLASQLNEDPFNLVQLLPEA